MTFAHWPRVSLTLFKSCCWYHKWLLITSEMNHVTQQLWCSHVKIPTHYTLPAQRSCWGGILVSLRPSVCPSVRPSVHPSRMPCPLCIIYSYGWILFILGPNDHYHERVCRAPWPLTLTYIFKVIRPWLRKSCPLCSVYSSGWILSIFGTNDHYH